jgi:hypothetical protein
LTLEPKFLSSRLTNASWQHSSVNVTAANGTRIKTYGLKSLNIDLGLLRTFNWTVEITDVSRAIIGADFLHYFGLLVDIRRRRLVDPTNRGTVIKSISSGTNTPLFVVNRSRGLDDILTDFSNVTRESPVPAKFRHDIEHVLQTTVYDLQFTILDLNKKHSTVSHVLNIKTYT